MAVPGQRPRVLSGEDWPDLFSRAAPEYARYRPTYPERLFDLLAAATEPGSACDIATGSGQAAGALARRFGHVVALDASARQIAAARSHQRLSYAVARAEDLPIRDAAVDLVTVAQAAHWIRLEPFYEEVRRVLRPGGVVALWTYGLCRVDAAVDRVLGRFYDEVVGPYWPAERHLVDEGYRSMPFPFARVPLPELAIEAVWRRGQLLGYIRTWSAVERFRKARSEDPVAGSLVPELDEVWPDTGPRRVCWPLTVLAGRVA